MKRPQYACSGKSKISEKTNDVRRQRFRKTRTILHRQEERNRIHDRPEYSRRKTGSSSGQYLLARNWIEIAQQWIRHYGKAQGKGQEDSEFVKHCFRVRAAQSGARHAPPLARAVDPNGVRLRYSGMHPLAHFTNSFLCGFPIVVYQIPVRVSVADRVLGIKFR